MLEVIPVISKAYRATRVNDVDWDRLEKGNEGVNITLGIDVGKSDLWPVCRWQTGRFERPWRVNNPAEIPTLVALIQRMSTGRKLVVALESSGTYGDALRQALADAKTAVLRVSNKASHESLRRWWANMGSKVYPDAKELLVTADGGGSNGSRLRLWKVAIQELADAIGLRTKVCHFPPGTSKWNKIEHRMFCHITQNWRGRPLRSLGVIVNLIGNTRTEAGLKIQAEFDRSPYGIGIKVSDEQLAALKMKKDDFHGEWNYTISPRSERD